MRWPRRLTGPALLLCGLTAALAAGQDPANEILTRRLAARQPGIPGQPGAAPAAKLSDEEALKKAGLSPTDGPKLLEYVKQRTLSDTEQGRIAEVIRRFAADDFDEREQATEEIETYGPAAVGPLKKAERDGDPEVAYRARLALRKLEKVPHAAVTAAAVRAVVRLKPEGAAAVLVGYLPLADSEAVADAIRQALVALAVAGGKAEPALVAALTDPSPVRRAAAYVALTEGGDAGERIRVKDAYPKVREAVLADADPEAKFAGLWALALTTREGEFVPELIGLIPKLGRGRIWQLEDLLLQLAGAHPKGGRFLKSPESLEAARDAWLGWWKGKGAKPGLAGPDYAPRVRGFTDIVEVDNRGVAQGRVLGLGPDLKEKWRFTGLNFPTDVRVAPDGNVWVVESNQNRVTERTPAGVVVTTRAVGTQPLNVDLLPDGGMVVVGRHQVVHWDKDGQQKWLFQRPNYDITAGRRLPGGETLVVTSQPPPQLGQPQVPNVFRLDEKGKEVKPADPKAALTFGYVYQLQAMDAVGEDRVLVCERDNANPGRPTDRVAEYDVKTGKQTWKYDCPLGSGPSSAQRLVNGNTLVCLMNQNKLIEVDTSGPSPEVVWEYQAKDNLRVGRAYRR